MTVATIFLLKMNTSAQLDNDVYRYKKLVPAVMKRWNVEVSLQMYFNFKVFRKTFLYFDFRFSIVCKKHTASLILPKSKIWLFSYLHCECVRFPLVFIFCCISVKLLSHWQEKNRPVQKAVWKSIQENCFLLICGKFRIRVLIL